jgi:hypothetical protein
MARATSILFPQRVHRLSFVVRFVICSVLTQLLYEHMPAIAVCSFRACNHNVVAGGSFSGHLFAFLRFLASVA